MTVPAVRALARVRRMLCASFHEAWSPIAVFSENLRDNCNRQIAKGCAPCAGAAVQ